MHSLHHINTAEAPLDMGASAFAEAGHRLIDQIAGFLHDLPGKPVTSGEQPAAIRAAIGNSPLPIHGMQAGRIISEAAELLFDHSLLNGHPSFWGYITSSAAPAGALADLLAAAVNPNTGAYILSPVATEIERQTIQWLAELIGYPAGSGVLVSGGNMANFIGFLAGRKAKATWDIRKEGFRDKQMVMYCSAGTHTWIQKAADIFGLGTDAIRWIDMNAVQQIDMEKLEQQVQSDFYNGYLPFLIAGTAGAVGSGAVDPLYEIAMLCRKYNLWFHVDGAYGAPAAMLPEYAETFRGLELADSVAIDPHKWLYCPLEAGCILVRDARHLTDTFSFHPEYYNFDGNAEDPCINYFDYGLQNSRGFRALKVWLAVKQAGKHGYQQMIRHNIESAQYLFALAEKNDQLQAVSFHLSVTAFRYVPKDMAGDDCYLNRLNEQLLNRLQAGGKVFLSHAIINSKYCLRVCIVNFRTKDRHLEELVAIVLEEGKKLDKEIREN